MNTIWIVGTQPPCPRCCLIKKVVESMIAEMNIVADIKHIVYTDIKAIDFAKNVGLEPGTAMDVANKINRKIDRQTLGDILKSSPPNVNCEYYSYNDCNWKIELDDYLRPYQNAALDVGIMITPVLIINGEIKHQGGVPGLNQIEQWLKVLK